MFSRAIIVLTFLILGPLPSASVQASRHKEIVPLTRAQQVSILTICKEPADLLPAAKSSLRNYFTGKYLNSSFFQNFLWVHPEYVEFATCVVCISGLPNDPYWEADFNLICEEDGVVVASEIESESSILSL